ncbi:hypothetical protein BpHYR1_045001, partial [Brachionus plicatilis]
MNQNFLKENRNESPSGFAYTKERGPNKLGKVSWKCEFTTKCNARGYSVGFEPPFTLTVLHKNHGPDFTRHQVLQSNVEIKNRAEISRDKARTIIAETNKEISLDAVMKLPNYDASRAKIQRARSNKAGAGKEFDELSKVEIKEELKVTYRNEKFLWGDSGSDDPERILALAFVKSEDVIEGFDLIKKKIRVAPRFPISTWNLYDRIMKSQPRTTNAVEAWHNALT